MPGIRRMVQTDLEQVAVIAAGLFTQPWDRQGFADALPLESACFLVAAEGDKVLGYCGLYMAADEGEVITGRVARSEEESRDLPVAFVPHWKTCTNAGDFRHKGGGKR